MSEENKKKTSGSGSGSGSGRSQGRSSSGGSSGKSSQSKSASSGSRSGSGASRSSSSGSTSKSGSGKSSSAGGSAKGSPAKGSNAGSAKSTSSGSKSSGGSSRSSSGSKPSGGSNRSTSSGSKSSGSAAKNSSASKGSGSSGGSRKNSSQSSRSNASGAKKRSSYDDVPRNPRRDTQDERDLHNSPSARRIADERRRRTYNKNRRLYNFMFYAAITVAVISVVVILSVTVLFNISSITVKKGEGVPYSDQEIIAACGIDPGDNLFAIDAQQAALDVTTGLPYIEVCNIYRKLPSTLELDVRAAVVLGSVTSTDGAYIVLSASGRALEYADAYAGHAARINGMNVDFEGIGMPVVIEDPAQLDVAAELVVGYSLYGLSLDSITFDSAGTVSANYDGRIDINIGVPTNLSQKIQVSASMISEGKIARNESGTLDMSIDERAVFTPDYLIAADTEGDL